MPKKDLSHITVDAASDASLPVARTFTPDGLDAPEPKQGEAPDIEAPGAKPPERTTVFLYQRDLDIIKNSQKELKKMYGKISKSEIIRFALNSMNIKDFRKGF